MLVQEEDVMVSEDHQDQRSMYALIQEVASSKNLCCVWERRKLEGRRENLGLSTRRFGMGRMCGIVGVGILFLMRSFCCTERQW